MRQKRHAPRETAATHSDIFSRSLRLAAALELGKSLGVDLVGSRWRVGRQLRFFGVKIDNLTDLEFMLGHREQPLVFEFER